MKKKILITLSVLLLISGYLYIESKFLKPNYLEVRKETITDDSIPDSFNNFEIVFFSDLNYDDSVNLNRISKKINNLNPDIVIFGGDVSGKSSYLYNQDTVNEITEFFKGIKANCAKYAVLGDKDNSSTFVIDTLNEIYINSGFEILNNQAIKFRLSSSDYINIVGLKDYISGSPKLYDAFSNIRPDTYTLVVTHSPDIFPELAATKCNLCLAGHSLGGKAILPIIGPLTRIDGAHKYYSGTHSLKGIKLDITDGIYPGSDNLRFLTNNEIVSYKIKKDISKKETAVTKPIETVDKIEDIKDEVNNQIDDIKDNDAPSIEEEVPSKPVVENVFN